MNQVYGPITEHLSVDSQVPVVPQLTQCLRVEQVTLLTCVNQVYDSITKHLSVDSQVPVVPQLTHYLRVEQITHLCEPGL